MLREGCYRISIVVLTGENDSLSCYGWTRTIFSQTEEKKLRFQKYPDTSGRGLKYGVYKMKFKIYLSKQNDLSKAEVDILLLGSLITDNNIFNIPSVKHTQKKFELNLAEFFSLEFLG